MAPLLGALGLGLVWGWLLVLRGAGLSRSAGLRYATIAGVATLLVGAQVAIQAGVTTLPAWPLGVAVAATAHAIWRRRLRQRALARERRSRT